MIAPIHLIMHAEAFSTPVSSTPRAYKRHLQVPDTAIPAVIPTTAAADEPQDTADQGVPKPTDSPPQFQLDAPNSTTASQAATPPRLDPVWTPAPPPIPALIQTQTQVAPSAPILAPVFQSNGEAPPVAVAVQPPKNQLADPPSQVQSVAPVFPEAVGQAQPIAPIPESAQPVVPPTAQPAPAAAPKKTAALIQFPTLAHLIPQPAQPVAPPAPAPAVRCTLTGMVLNHTALFPGDPMVAVAHPESGATISAAMLAVLNSLELSLPGFLRMVEVVYEHTNQAPSANA